ncbi:hypothetical protein BST61_g7607 [Cercospora zeina]
MVAKHAEAGHHASNGAMLSLSQCQNDYPNVPAFTPPSPFDPTRTSSTIDKTFLRTLHQDACIDLHPMHDRRPVRTSSCSVHQRMRMLFDPTRLGGQLSRPLPSRQSGSP